LKKNFITKITPYLFEDNLILSLSHDWIKVFKKIPDFEVIIDNTNRLVIRSKEKLSMSDYNYNTNNKKINKKILSRDE